MGFGQIIYVHCTGDEQTLQNVCFGHWQKLQGRTRSWDQNKNLEVRERGMALDRGLKNPRKRLQSAVLSLEKTQGRCDKSFQKCEWMPQKRNATNTSEQLRRERAMNLKCKQRQHVTVGKSFLIGRTDKLQKTLFRKTVKFQAVWSYSGSYLPAHRGHPVYHQSAME